MSAHPSTKSLQAKTLFGVASAAAMVGLWLLLAIYTELSVWGALFDSLLYISILIFFGYIYWFVVEYIQNIVTKVGIALIVQLLCIGLVFVVMAITGSAEIGSFARIIPVHIVYGVLLWVILSMWYGSFTESSIREETEDIVTVREQILERIYVKNGMDIKIIPVEQLDYIQAYGDYVLLFSANERHIKEQTMKFYENSLPDNFVRVHRSFIINTERIARVELAGKENYNIKLKNGVGIRASSSGYKLLRQRLSL